MKAGKLYGVSVGPGDPELMTIKAVRIIRQADVIAIPHGKKESCAAYQIALQAVPEIEKKECLMISMPMTKDSSLLKESRLNGAKKILSVLVEGKDVALLTLGDISIYSTGWYLYCKTRELSRELPNGAEGELIGGVPSFCAAAQRLERALICGEEELHILPASYSAEQIEQGLLLPGVKVLMKAGKQISAVKKLIQDKNLPVCAVSRCGMEGEKVYWSAEEIEEDAGYYLLILVG